MANAQFEPLKLTQTQRDRFGRIRNADQMQKLDPRDFELFCGYLYELQGYQVFLTSLSADQGIDLVLRQGNQMIVAQCKRYSGTVGQPIVRDLYGTMLHNRATGAALLTPGRISRAAEEWAEGKPIQLVDGHELISWLRRYRGVRASGGGWLSRNLRQIAVAVVIVGLLTICLVLSAVGVSFYRDRATRVGQLRPTLVIPTPNVTGAVVVAPTEASDRELVATATLRPTTTPPSERADLIAERFETSPPLSTDLSSWQGIAPVSAPFVVAQDDSWNGEIDVDASWRLGYDERHLYGLVVVRDNVLAQTETAKYAYRGDSLEVEIDTLYDRAQQATEDDYQFIFSPGNFGTLAPSAFRFRGAGGSMQDDWGTNAQVVAEATDDGYIIAFRIPWYDLRIYEAPQPGMTMGIALNINDNDTPGVPMQELMLSHVATRRWSRPSTWGSITLGE